MYEDEDTYQRVLKQNLRQLVWSAKANGLAEEKIVSENGGGKKKKSQHFQKKKKQNSCVPTLTKQLQLTEEV